MSRSTTILPAVSISYCTSSSTGSMTPLSDSPFSIVFPKAFNKKQLDDTDLGDTTSQTVLGINEPGESQVKSRLNETDFGTLVALGALTVIYFKIGVTTSKNITGAGIINGLQHEGEKGDRMNSTFTIIWNSAITVNSNT
jgi:hypothetical protein